eukprot:jgi/Chlat1/2088/Chrsp17S02687
MASTAVAAKTLTVAGQAVTSQQSAAVSRSAPSQASRSDVRQALSARAMGASKSQFSGSWLQTKSRPAKAQWAATHIVSAAVEAYPQGEVDKALEYLERMRTFPNNYYSPITLNLGRVFSNTNKSIPASLGSKDFSVDFSTLSTEKAPPLIIEDALRIEGIRIYRKTQRDVSLPQIRQSYGNPNLVEQENKIWWLTHCQALRDGDKANKVLVIDGIEEEYSGLTVLFNEYRDELMYFTKDSLYDTAEGGQISATPDAEGLKGYWFGRQKGNTYESSWWAMLANPRVRMTWPRVTFSGEDVSFDWVCFDINTNEMTAYGDVVWIRTGDRGACYKKYEHLYFLRDVYKTFFDNYFKDGASSGSSKGAFVPDNKGIVKAVGERKGKIACLIEEHFDPFEFRSYNEYYPKNGYDMEYLTYLWGADSVRYTSNPTDGKIEEDVTVTKCVTKVKPKDYAGILVIGAYAMDRLRYQSKVWKGKKNDAPGVEFVRQTMRDNVPIGNICHSIWIFCAAPELLKGKKVTCAHNLVCDVEGAGAEIVYEGEGTAELVIDGNLICGKHPGMVEDFNVAFIGEVEKAHVRTPVTV